MRACKEWSKIWQSLRKRLLIKNIIQLFFYHPTWEQEEQVLILLSKVGRNSVEENLEREFWIFPPKYQQVCVKVTLVYHLTIILRSRNLHSIHLQEYLFVNHYLFFTRLLLMLYFLEQGELIATTRSEHREAARTELKRSSMGEKSKKDKGPGGKRNNRACWQAYTKRETCTAFFSSASLLIEVYL